MRRETRLPRLSRRLYAALLRLYPRGFRERFGREMARDFEEMCRDTGGAGLAVLSLWRHTAADLFRSLLSEWSTVMRSRNLLLHLSALAVGLTVGFIDMHLKTDDGAPGALLALAPSFAFGLAQPRRAGRWALLIGPGFTLANLIGLAFGYVPPSPPQPNAFAALLAVIPALIGAYAGAVLRNVIAPPPAPAP